MRYVSYLIISVLVLLGSNAAIAEECEPCSRAAQLAEYNELFQTFRDAVNAARDKGFKCSRDPDYSDLGDGNHTLGNCADWQRVTWDALVKKQWNCWDVVKIRAKRKFSIAPPIYHHFVMVRPKCSQNSDDYIYFDPWVRGIAVAAQEKYFRFSGGVFSWWIHYPQDFHRAGDTARLPP